MKNTLELDSFELGVCYYPEHWDHDDSQDVVTADLFNDILHVESDSVDVIAEYASDYYVNQPALTKNTFGNGEAWYYGAAFNDKVVKRIIDHLNIQSPVGNWLTLPQQVEVGIRRLEGKSSVFLLNYSGEAVDIIIDHEKHDVLLDKKISGKVKMEGYGVIILV